MVPGSAVLSRKNGLASAKILFVAEAPGRLGAHRTRVPFSGDQSGRTFDMLLDHIGLTRRDIFITNAVLCCPFDGDRNGTPTRDERDRCRPFLAAVIDALRPRIIVTLGAVALEAVSKVFGARWRLRDVIGQPMRIQRRVVIGLYHPSPKVIAAHRSLDQQMTDFQAIRRVLDDGGVFGSSL
jgi:DNA polymerase